MKKTNYKTLKVLPLLLTFNFLLLTSFCFSQSGAAINTSGTSADASAILDVSSTDAGMLIPRMTKIQRNAIGTPAEGLLIYQTDDTIGFWYHSVGMWKLIGSGDGSSIANGTAAGNTLYWNGSQWVESSNIFNAGGSVGIGTNNPDNSTILDLQSTTKGFAIPRMTTAERNAIQNPAEGLQIFNTTTNCLEFYVNNQWNIISCPFAFECGNKLVDSRDGQYYQTVQIGTQCWMKENLKYLPIVHSNSEFATQATNSQPGYGVWGYDGSNVASAKSQANYSIYGVLYNWFAATSGASSSSNPSGVQGICPAGWHMPSDAEWQQLEIYLGMDPSVANSIGWRGTNQGDQLKSTTLWTLGGTATNSSSFSAISGGGRSLSGTFVNFGNYGYWWSVTEDGSSAWRRILIYDDAAVYRNTGVKGDGYAVRCLKN